MQTHPPTEDLGPPLRSTQSSGLAQRGLDVGGAHGGYTDGPVTGRQLASDPVLPHSLGVEWSAGGVGADDHVVRCCEIVRAVKGCCAFGVCWAQTCWFTFEGGDVM